MGRKLNCVMRGKSEAKQEELKQSKEEAKQKELKRNKKTLDGIMKKKKQSHGTAEFLPNSSVAFGAYTLLRTKIL